MKKITAILLVLATFLCGICVYADAENVFTVRVDSKEAKAGEVVELNVNMENNSGILAMLFVLNYDPECLKLTEVRNGTIVDGAVFGKDYSKVPYKMLWNSAAETNYTEDGVLATLVFEIVENAPGESTEVTLTYKERNVYDVNLNPVNISVVNGTVSWGDVETNVPQGSSGSIGSYGGGYSKPIKSEDNDVQKDTTIEEDEIIEEDDFEVSLLDYNDVKESDWFYDSVKFVREHNYMSGVSNTEFAPMSNLTRGMIVTVLYRLEGEPECESSKFDDVADGMWYSNGISWAAETGVVNGIGDNKFAPDSNVTREQIAVIMYNYSKSHSFDVTETKSVDSFNDADKVSSWASEAIEWAIGTGLLSGKGDGILDPKGNATRAEIAAIFTRYVERYAGSET